MLPPPPPLLPLPLVALTSAYLTLEGLGSLVILTWADLEQLKETQVPPPPPLLQRLPPPPLPPLVVLVVLVVAWTLVDLGLLEEVRVLLSLLPLPLPLLLAPPMWSVWPVSW